ncbi:uncharacterized protein [Anoplolepis gracilipes]|uniref:uncharacterized protein n=1 Tax=Anoplolepis gracilipes TaxID=354296 RepID=UPI003BA2F616
MQNNAGLNAETLTESNVASFAQCILELVTNSLIAHATAIAIRIHAGKREVQIIDNGVGMSKAMLQHVAEYDNTVGDQQQMYELIQSNKHTLKNIRRLSNSLTIASRHQYSADTFMKICKIGSASNLARVKQRPTHGTTVSVYGFHEVSLSEKWDMSTVCFFIAAAAVTKLEVSFSIRDEERRKIVLRIAKPHSPIQVLKTFFGESLLLNHLWLIQYRSELNNVNYHGYVGLSNRNVAQWIFLNHRSIYCPLILEIIKIVFEERSELISNRGFNTQDLRDKNMFILLFLTFSPREFTFFNENGKRHVMFYDLQKILNSIKNCTFKRITKETTISALSDLCETKPLNQMYLKSEVSIFNNKINDKNVISLNGNKVVTSGLKRKRTITSTIVTNKQHNKESNTMEIVNCAEEENRGLNSQADIASTKHTNLCEDKITKKMHSDVDRMPGTFTNLAVTNDVNEPREIYNHPDGNDNDFGNMISPLSEWSNWSYHTNNRKCNSAKNLSDKVSKREGFQQLFNHTDQFYFLPRKLHGLLRHRHVKLTNVKCFNSPSNTISSAENWQHNQIAVHPCTLKRKLCEVKLSRVSLERIKIINQVNDEFIAAWMMYDEMKILLMIDQHAVHERIRYENLLLKYKGQNEGELLSINLRNPLAMEISTKTRDSLLRRKMLLKKYGINLGSLKENTKLLIRTIPQCLVTNNDRCKSEKILPKIYGLLNDILKDRSTSRANTLPLTIHNAIASEACHGIYQTKQIFTKRA